MRAMSKNNPIFQQYGNQQMRPQYGGTPAQQGMPDPFGSMNGLQNQWQQFQQNYHGNAQQEVQQLLQSGRMTPKQYQAFQAIARRIAPFLGGR